MTSGESSLRSRVRVQAAWNRQNLAQGRLRAYVSAWLDVRDADRRDLNAIITARGISRQAALNALAFVMRQRGR